MLSHSLYNPTIIQQQNYLFQRNYNNQAQNSSNMPAPHMQLQNYPKLPSPHLQIPQQSQTTSNKNKNKDYAQLNVKQNGNFKTNVISDTFLKPITNYIIPNIYNSRLDTNQYDLKSKPEAKIAYNTKPKIENVNNVTKNPNSTANQQIINDQKPQFKQFIAQQNHELSLDQVKTNILNSNNSNSVKLILNSKKLEASSSKTPSITPPKTPVILDDAQLNLKPLTVSPTKQNNLYDTINIDAKESCIRPGSLDSNFTINGNDSKQKNDNFQINQTKNLLYHSNNVNLTNKSEEPGDYAFILHEKSYTKTNNNNNEMFKNINELEAAIEISKQQSQKSELHKSHEDSLNKYVSVQYTNNSNNININNNNINNRKPRFKTIHIEPSVVREAVERNRLNEQIKTVHQTLSPCNEPSKYNIFNNNDVNTLNNFLNDYLTAEKEINSFYNHFNKLENKAVPPGNQISSQKTCESTSMKSSLNSLLSSSSQAPEQQHNQAILPTSGYSSFNSQQSNKVKLNFDNISIANNNQKQITSLHANYNPGIVKNNDKYSVKSTSSSSEKNSNDSKDMLNTNNVSVVNSQTKQDKDKIPENGNKLAFKNGKHVEHLINTFNTAVGSKEQIQFNDESSHISRTKKQQENITNIQVFQNCNSPVNNQILKTVDHKSKSQEKNIDQIKQNLIYISHTKHSKLPESKNEDDLSKYNKEKSIYENKDQLKTKCPAKETDIKKDILTIKSDVKDIKTAVTTHNKIQTKIKPKASEKAVKVHHGVPPPPPVVGKIKSDLRSKHVSLSPTKQRESFFGNYTEKNTLITNKSSINQKQYDTAMLDSNKSNTQQKDNKDNDSIFNDYKSQFVETKYQQTEFRKSSEKAVMDLKIKSNMTCFQQKHGTLHAPHRKPRHSILNQAVHIIKRMPQDSFEMSFSISEENNSNGFTNKTNLPNLTGVDYYYKSKNENKINVSNYLRLQQQSQSSSNHLVDFESLITGQAFSTHWTPMFNISKHMEKSTSLPWMSKTQNLKNKTFYQNYLEENDRRRREGNGFLMLLPGIAIPIEESGIVDSDEESGTK